VALFGRSAQLGANRDPDVQAAMQALFNAELDLRLHTEITAASPVADGVELEWRELADDDDNQQPAAIKRERFATVLIAAGRRPQLAGLNIDATGLRLDARGIPERDPETTQCGDLPIFMAGDVSAYIPLLHEASDEGRIAGANAIRYPDVKAHIRREPLAITFTHPQAAAVGAHYTELDPSRVVIGQVEFTRQGRALVSGTNQGILRVYADKTDCRLVGAEMLAPQAEHMAHLLAWVIQQNLTLEQILKLPVYHPVLEEGMRAALRDAAKQLKLSGSCRQNTLAPGD
jgi:dihydrolipoamide dehydrogenase